MKAAAPAASASIAATVLVIAACGSGDPSGPNDIAGISAAGARSPATDLAYMKAHPVPPRPGMTAGIVTSVTWLGDQCKPRAPHTAALVVGQDPCAAWSFTIITAAGQTLKVSCGSIGRPCPATVPQNVSPGEEGEYLYVPDGGRITPSRPVAFLECTTLDAYPCPFGAPVSVQTPDPVQTFSWPSS